jgi:predicted amidohydrolase YtcJ
VDVRTGATRNVSVGEGRPVDLGDAVLLPGLVDAHMHLRNLGAQSRWLDLRGVASVDALAKRVNVAAQPGQWLLGRGWDDSLWPPHTYDPAIFHPEALVWLTRVDGHAAWLNAKALLCLGPEGVPEGGAIRGGLLVDRAMDIASAGLPSEEAFLAEDLVRGAQRCAEVGLTCVHDMMTTRAELEALASLELPIRVCCYTHDFVGEGPQVRGRKFFLDGALGSHGAWMHAPYCDCATSGLVVTDPREVALQAQEVAAHGQQVAIHAIGDRANTVALDILEGLAPARHRIEHAQIVRLEDVARFRRAGIVASMQPAHCRDLAWADKRIGPRTDNGYAWRRMLDAGVHVALGSDAPVESHDPWLGMQAAIQADAMRRLTRQEALSGFSVAARFAAFDEAVDDYTVVDQIPLALPPERWSEIRVLGTVVNGETHGEALLAL